MMQVEFEEAEDCLVVSLIGVLKKPDAMEIGEKIAKALRGKPKKLALNLSDLAAISFDSVPFLISAIERARLGKRNVRAFGCNSVVERTLRGGDFERIGILD